LPRAVAITTLLAVSIWVHQLGGVHAGKDVAADGSISTDRYAYSKTSVTLRLCIFLKRVVLPSKGGFSPNMAY